MLQGTKLATKTPRSTISGQKFRFAAYHFASSSCVSKSVLVSYTILFRLPFGLGVGKGVWVSACPVEREVSHSRFMRADKINSKSAQDENVFEIIEKTFGIRSS